MPKNIFSLLMFAFSVCVICLQGHAQTTEKSPIPKSRIIELSEKAAALAQSKLSVNPKDVKGLVLVKFAHHFNSGDRALLLLRAKLKYNIKIEKPENEVSEADFLNLLTKSAELFREPGNDKNRQLMGIVYSMIRLIQPNNEDALVVLMELQDAGAETELDKLLSQNISDYENPQSIEYDPKDPRYIISNVKKTITVPADVPWTDTWVKVKEGKIIRVKSARLWSMGGGPFPSTDANGYDNAELMKVKKEGKNFQYSTYTTTTATALRNMKTTSIKRLKSEATANLGSLIAKIGNKIYPAGVESTFRADTSGVLFFGPYEWDDYSDNTGFLTVTFEISDK